MATTTIWRGSRNGRPAARRRKWNERRNPARRPRRAARRLRPVAVGLGRGQCRLGQDACAGAARDPPAAARHAAGKDPLPHLSPRPPPPTWRTACSTRCAKWTAMDDAGARRRDREDRRPPAGASAARARAAAVRAGARYTGRPEGTDHPRLLHAAAAPVPVRSGRRGALRGAGGTHAIASCSTGCAWACCSKPPPSRTATLGRALATAITLAADRTFTEVIGEMLLRHEELTAWINAAGGVAACDPRPLGRTRRRPDETSQSIDEAFFSTR